MGAQVRTGARVGACAAPVALALACAAPAFAHVPSVSVRVEGTHRTIVGQRTVTPPAHGWVTKGGAPRGSCPADSAAGALGVATRGHWTGSYDQGLGVEVTSILGTRAVYAKGSYWSLYVDDHLASTGVCDVRPASGQSLLLAQVPAKGATPLPLVLTAPRHAVAGRPFTVRTYVYPGKGKRTRAVRHAHFTITEPAQVGRVTLNPTDAGGRTAIVAAHPGRLRIAATAHGDIRSASETVVVR
jgi:hypothetical protein